MLKYTTQLEIQSVAGARADEAVLFGACFDLQIKLYRSFPMARLSTCIAKQKIIFTQRALVILHLQIGGDDLRIRHVRQPESDQCFKVQDGGWVVLR